MTSKLVKTERKPISKIYQTASSTEAILRSWKERQAHPHCYLLRAAPSLQRTEYNRAVETVFSGTHMELETEAPTRRAGDKGNQGGLR